MGRKLALGGTLIFGILAATPAAAHATLLQDAPPSSENAPAHPIPDQTITAEPSTFPREPAASIFLAAAAIGCLIYIARRRLYDPVATPPTREWPLGRVADWPALLLGGMTVWLAQSAGAASAVMLFSLAESERDSLRGGALVSLGGYLGAAIGAACTLAILPGMAARIRLDRPSADFVKIALRAAAAFALIFPIVMTIGWIAAVIARWYSGEPPDAVAHKTLRLLSDPAAIAAEGSTWWWLTTISVLLGAPIAEEMVYRGFIQSAIRRAVLWSAESRAPDGLRIPPSRRAAWTAIIGTSALFASMHIGVAETHALFTLFALSLCFGIACERSGRLLAPIVMHILFNAANLALSFVN